jgi:hypothetical protein
MSPCPDAPAPLSAFPASPLDDTVPPRARLLALLEAASASTLPAAWLASVPAPALERLVAGRAYRLRSLPDCLRLLRNKEGHHRELDAAQLSVIGHDADARLSFFTSRAPRLLLHAYIVAAHVVQLRSPGTQAAVEEEGEGEGAAIVYADAEAEAGVRVEAEEDAGASMVAPDSIASGIDTVPHSAPLQSTSTSTSTSASTSALGPVALVFPRPRWLRACALQVPVLLRGASVRVRKRVRGGARRNRNKGGGVGVG